MLISLLIIAACFFVRSMLDDWLKPYFPTQFFFIGSILIAVLYGYLPASISLVVGWLLGIYYFIEPYGEFSAASTYDIIVTGNNFVTGIAGIVLVEYLQRTRYSRRLNLLVSESRYRSLLRLDNHRIHQQRQVNRAMHQISEFVVHLERALLVISPDREVQYLPGLTRLLSGRAAPREADWRGLIHSDDRDAVEVALQPVLEGQAVKCDLSFRLAGRDPDLRVECEFRALPVGAHKTAYALTLKPTEAR